MSTKQRIRRSVVAQFHHPTGLGGHVAGWIMSHRPSNLARNRWAVDLLDIQPAERVLELGCGPGVALAEIAQRVVDGVAVGVDHSPVMIRHAGRRNAAAVAAGRVQLVCAAVEDLLPADGDVPGVGPPIVRRALPGGAGRQQRRLLGSARTPPGRSPTPDAARWPSRPGHPTPLLRRNRRNVAGQRHRTRRPVRQGGYTGITSATLDLDPPAVCVRATATGP